jgi:uncharacterized protein
MKLVLDTNVLLSAVLVPGLGRDLLRGPALAHDWFTSPVLLAELADKLRRKLDLEPEQTPLFLMYRRRARLIEPAPWPVSVCRDPDDDHVLAAAVGASADLILTGDKDLLVLGAHQGIRIRSPRQFADAPLV